MDPSLFGYSLEDFREEAGELLERAETVLSEIKESPGDHDKINALFRAIHSLKGSAAYSGLKDVNDFAHLYESFLGDLRNRKYQVDGDIVNILVRARDYLEDLIFHPDSTETPKIIEGIESSRERLSTALKSRGKGVAQGARSYPPPSPEVAVPAETPKAKAEDKTLKRDVTLATVKPDMMDQKDVIKVTVIKGLKVIAACLKKKSPDCGLLSRAVAKLEETVLWAFGEDASAAIEGIEKMKEILSGVVGPPEIMMLRRGFNPLAQALKGELIALDGPVEGDGPPPDTAADRAGEKDEQEAEKSSAEKIRGASEEEIVMITVTKALDKLSLFLGEDKPDVDRLRRMVRRLKDLNRWAFEGDEGVNGLLTSMEDMLLRPYNGSVAAEMRRRYSTVKSLLTALLGKKEEEGPSVAIEERSPLFHARQPVPVTRAVRPRKAPPAPGPTLRVRSDDLETLMNTVGDLGGLDPKALERLQTQTLQLRMVPVGELFSRFRKVVRDLSEELGKEIDLDISGESVKLDKTIVDRIQEPLLHMVRNAASHGLETTEERAKAGKERGIIGLSAYQEGGQIIIEVSDNGRGISTERIKKRGVEMGLIKPGAKGMDDRSILDLIFAPGFSTKDEADSVSGRGVGMDVVKDVINSLQGTITIETEEGRGTIFRLLLPLTLAIVRALLLEESGSKIALPAASVDRVITMTEDEIRGSSFVDKNRLSLDLRDEGEVIPLVNFSRIFKGEKERGKKRCVVLVKTGFGHKVALVVDSALGRQPLTVKPLDRFAGNRYFSSASVIKDDLVLILNVPSLMAA